jgi:DNA end-binding protein Ku
MATRALWSGSIAFGRVNVPVRVYSALHEQRLRFHLVHEPDDGPIGYEKVCKLEDKPVADNEIVKAFEYAKGKVVHLGDEDFEAVQVEGQRTIELADFVPYDEIDPIFFAHTYLVGPQEGAEKTYALLARAMRESGLAGIGKFVMRNRQHLGCLRVRDRMLNAGADALRRRDRRAGGRRARPPARRVEAGARAGPEADRGPFRPLETIDS